MNSAFEDSLERLGRDVSFLGRVLGDVLREQGGDELFATVEGLRVASRHHRQYHCDEAAGDLAALVAALPLERALEVVRAFTMYFHLINIAEENHRIRRLDERESANPGTPRQESIHDCIATLCTNGAGPEDLRALIAGLSIRPVFTAHPTEARRMTLMRQLQRIASIVRSLDTSPPPEERRRLVERLYAEVTDLWQTNELRTRDQTPLDEVRNGLYYFDASVFEVTARIYRQMHEALADAGVSHERELPPFLTFGTWIGGDRDGNPAIVPAVTERALRMQRTLVLRRYAGAVRELIDLLTPSLRLAPAGADLLASIERDREELGIPNAALEVRWQEEPYRRKLSLMLRRLTAMLPPGATEYGAEGERDSAAPAAGGYRHADEFRDDLRLLARSLRAGGGGRIAADRLQDLQWQVTAFGFHLAAMDVRQHRDRHSVALRELFPDGRLGEGDDDTDTHFLATALMHPLPRIDGRVLSAETTETLDLLHTIRRMQDEIGREAVETYVVSFSSAPADVLGVLLLARFAQLCDLEAGWSRLSVVPLFETLDDLERAPEVMDALYHLPVYRRQIEARGGRQEVMLGYSDSDKDAGYVASNVGLYRAQQRLADGATRAGVALTVFHGRGGAIGRGGGPLQRAILGQPPGTVAGRIKVTEQGEVLFTRYANPGIAHRHLEQLVSAVLRASVSRPVAEQDRWEGMARQMSHVAERAYRNLVEDAPGFLTFFEEGTPVGSIGRLRIASRPSRRPGGAARLADLRAIPWVFAWTQARWGLPGWFGLGSALEAAIHNGQVEEVRRMYRRWPFFQWLIDAAQISLGKADLGIADAYTRLVRDAATRATIASHLRDEFDRTVAMVNAVVGQQRLLDSWPVLQRSIELRNPYVDPMSYIQIRCLAELRVQPEGPHADLARSVIDRSIAGVAAGLQNTG